MPVNLLRDYFGVFNHPALLLITNAFFMVQRAPDAS